MSNLFLSGSLRHLNRSDLDPSSDNFFGDNEDFSVDIKETDEAFIVVADLPGLDKENIELDYFNNVLCIRTHQEEEERNDEGNYIHRERSSRSFRRQFLIENINEEEIRASFKQGVLTINLPKDDIDEDERKKIKIDSL